MSSYSKTPGRLRHNSLKKLGGKLLGSLARCGRRPRLRGATKRLDQSFALPRPIIYHWPVLGEHLPVLNFRTTLISRIAVTSCLFSSLSAHAVDASKDPLIFEKIPVGDVDIVIDGKLDESLWSRLQAHDNMEVIEPDTLEKGQFQTLSRFFYTDQGLYIGVWAEQDPETLVSRLTSRDRYIARDDISFTLDTSGEGLYGYWFGVNLGGTLMDGTVLPESQYSSQWDGPWQGASAEIDNGWSTEMFLPWSMMSMPQTNGTRKMGFYISRQVSYLDERWSWPALPRTRRILMSGLQPFQLEDINPQGQYTIYPYASSTFNNIENEDAHRTGLDIFWRPSSNLQFTATINPDFGQVESDDVVVNLTAFETFFPEKRPFFLEGNEIFVTTPRAQTGHRGGGPGRGPPTTLVNTRRIGGAPIAPDIADDVDLPSLELSQPSKLHGAVKVTGQRNKFRYGFMAAFEADTVFLGFRDGSDFNLKQTGRDFGIARFLYEDASSGGRKSVGWISTLVAHDELDAVVHGIDAHYLSPDKRWVWDLQLMHSDVDGVTGSGGFFDAKFTPRRGTTHTFKFDYLDEKLDINDLGFLRRNDSININYNYSLSDPTIDGLKSRNTSITVRQQYNTDHRLTDSQLSFRRFWSLLNNSRIFGGITYRPERWDDRNSDDNGDYKVLDRWSVGLNWRSDSAKILSYRLGFDINSEYLHGVSYRYDGGVTWRPNHRFSIEFMLSYEDRDGWLIHAGERDFTTYEAEDWRPNIDMDFFLTAKQQFRVTMQWAGIKARQQEHWQVPLGGGRLDEVPVSGENRDFTISRLTFQARYRWELAPLSDLFVVYTRGANVPSAPADSFGDLLKDAWTDKIVDVFVVKLRYRLGN